MESFPGRGGGSVRVCRVSLFGLGIFRVFGIFTAETVVSESALRMPLTPFLAEL